MELFNFRRWKTAPVAGIGCANLDVRASEVVLDTDGHLRLDALVQCHEASRGIARFAIGCLTDEFCFCA